MRSFAPEEHLQPAAITYFSYITTTRTMMTKQQLMIRRPRLLTAAVTTTVLLSVAAVISAFAPPSSLSSRITNQNHQQQHRITFSPLYSSNPNQQQQQQQQQPSSSDEELTIEGYSRCLSPWEAKRSVKNESRQYSIIDQKPKWQKPISLVSKGMKKVITKPKKPGSLILLRCGESKWTKTGRFTGWGEYSMLYEMISCVYVHVYINVLCN